jgi:methyl-accepting chemotaxis protein
MMGLSKDIVDSVRTQQEMLTNVLSLTGVIHSLIDKAAHTADKSLGISHQVHKEAEELRELVAYNRSNM